MTEKVFGKGEVIFSQGEQGDSFYRVLSGCIGIYAEYGEADELKLTELKEGQFFGEMAVIEAYPRSATAVSLSDDTKLLEVAGDEISTFMTEKPDNLVDLMTHLSNRLQELTRDYDDVSGLIEELKNSGKEERGESFAARIRRHINAHKARKIRPYVGSAEYFNDITKDVHKTTWKDRMRSYPKGTVICKEGEILHCMYDLQQGTVGIYKGFGTKKEKKIGELYPNSFFGEAGMLTDEPRSATVVALDEVTIEIIYREDLDDLLEKNPPKLEMILRNLSYRLRFLTNRYTEACALLDEAVEEEENSGKMTPEMAEKVAGFKSRLYE